MRSAACVLVALLALAGGCRGGSHGGERVVDLLEVKPEGVLAESRTLELGGGGRSVLVSGWSRPELDRDSGKGQVWATAPDATLRFELFRLEAQQMLVTLRPWPELAGLGVEVRVNDHPIGTLTAEGGFYEHRFEIPLEVLKRGPNLLTFRHSALSDARGTRDGRRFAAAYSTLFLGPACAPLRALGIPTPPGVDRHDAAWRLTAPTRFSWRVTIRPGTRLRLRFQPPAEHQGPIDAHLVLRDRGAIVPLGQVTIERGLFRSRPTELVADVARFAGRRVELRLALDLERCGPPSGTTVLTEAVLERPPS